MVFRSLSDLFINPKLTAVHYKNRSKKRIIKVKILQNHETTDQTANFIRWKYTQILEKRLINRRDSPRNPVPGIPLKSMSLNSDQIHFCHLERTKERNVYSLQVSESLIYKIACNFDSRTLKGNPAWVMATFYVGRNWRYRVLIATIFQR